VLKPASSDVGFEVDRGRLHAWGRDVRLRTGGDHNRALGLGPELGLRHNPAIGRFVRHCSGRRRRTPCLESFDAVRETPDVSLELEGANESDDGKEDPGEDGQRSEYREHSVLDEMLARLRRQRTLSRTRSIPR
jgi:hypothetical protein